MLFEYPEVTVLLPTMNRKKSLKRTLRSLSRLVYPKHKLKIMIIDNASHDNTVNMTHKNFPKIKVIHLPFNIGFGPALNEGISRTTTPFMLVTNDDVIFDKNCLKEMVKLSLRSKNIGIVSCKMFFADRPTTLALQGFKVNLWLGYHPTDLSGVDTVRETDVATGGCMLINYAVIKRIGYFNQSFFFSGEDYDFCFRVRRAGFKIMHCPEAIVWHEFLNAGKRQENFFQLYSHYRGKFHFMFVHAHIFQIMSFVFIQFTIGPIYSYYNFGIRTLIPMLWALGWNARHMKQTLAERKRLRSSLKIDYKPISTII